MLLKSHFRFWHRITILIPHNKLKTDLLDLLTYTEVYQLSEVFYIKRAYTTSIASAPTRFLSDDPVFKVTET